MKAIGTHRFYLESKPYEVVETNCILESTPAIYPTYYVKNPFLPNELFVSNSAYAIAKKRSIYLGRFKDNINEDMKINRTPQSFQTHDKRVMRVEPFQKITIKDGKITKTNTFQINTTIKDIFAFVELSAELLTQQVHLMEKTYPNAKHIMEVGGKDSQILLLIPKLNPDNWFVFSAKPNYEIILDFIKANEIKVKGIYSDEDDNEYDDKDFIREKVIASDGLINLKTIQWGKTHQEEIRESFAGEPMFFWDGTSGGGLNSPLFIRHMKAKKDLHEMRVDFFNYHFNRTPLFAGLYHQCIKNLTGRPVIDLYNFPMLWDKLYSRYDPLMFRKYDCRKDIGRRIFGKEVDWITDRNPAPPAWNKQAEIDFKKIYFDALTRN